MGMFMYAYIVVMYFQENESNDIIYFILHFKILNYSIGSSTYLYKKKHNIRVPIQYVLLYYSWFKIIIVVGTYVIIPVI